MSRIQHIEQHWSDHTTHLLTECNDSEIKGSVCITDYPADKETWIHSLYVNEVHREQGIARRLLNEAENHAKYLPIHICVYRFAPQWLKDRYMKRGYIIHVVE